MDELDLFLARAARSLLAHNKADLATKLLSCRVKQKPGLGGSGSDFGLYVHISGPREMYELFWNSADLSPTYDDPDMEGVEVDKSALLAALLHAFGSQYTNIPVKVIPTNAVANRSAAEQTELYMYVFGDDPIGQQVQVLDVGQHSVPTRQLIVSPVPVLPVTDLDRDQKLCFVMMPFAPQFRPVFDNAIASAVTAAGMTCRRGDDISQPGAILTQIWHSLLQARLVIADLSGGNGNVLYELGLAHVLGHEAILLTQDIANVPFDLRHQRTIVYSPQGSNLEGLKASLTAAIQSSLAVKR